MVAIKRMDHTTLVVKDLPGAIKFFKDLGMELQGQASVEGPQVDALCGLKKTKADIAMMKTPDGHSGIELTKYHRPAVIKTTPKIMPPNALGLRQIMFEVDDLDGLVKKMKTRGGKLLGEIVEYGGVYKLCYLRGPEGVIVALAQQIG